MTTQREYADGALSLLLADRQITQLEMRVLHNYLRRVLPLLLNLWDAAQETAGTISMRQEHSCFHTYGFLDGFLDGEPALKMIAALDELRRSVSKETK